MLQSFTHRLSGALLVAAVSAAAGYEAPPYSELRTEGKFELREYEAIRVAETPLAAGTRRHLDSSFERLFRYISGANDAEKKIAMTVPVLMTSGELGTMAFVLPAALKRPPAPKDEEVRVAPRDLGTVATISFSGRAKAKDRREKEAQLRGWIESQGLSPVGESHLAVYNPPWIPGIFRHNELLIPVAVPATPVESDDD